MNKQLFVQEHSVFYLQLWFTKLVIMDFFLDLFCMSNRHCSK
jgi:hypothetical protein